ncbi:MAG: Fic family protein [Vulcanimicrobiota bacterium]
MFKPFFTYTDRMVRNLVLIAEARTIILNAHLVPKWEVSLRRDALIRSAHSSTAIEGNPLSIEEVSALAEGREIMVQRKDRQEVLNYLSALEKIPEFAQKTPFTAEDLLRLHHHVTQDVLNNPADEGAFRNRQVVVGNRLTGAVVFKPPKTEEVPGLVDSFLDWFNSPDSRKIEPVLEAGITHYEIVRIHPFIDGNGRTARLMATMAFYRSGFDMKRFFALDDYYDNDRRSYYAALKAVNQKTLDLTNWLDYFAEGVVLSLKAVNDKILALSLQVKKVKNQGQISLTDRQMKIVERIVDKGRITIGEVAKEFGITRQAALKEMDKLASLGVTGLKGKGRGSYYIVV